MKKTTRNVLLSTLATATLATAITATALNITGRNAFASDATESVMAADGFEMLDGASIRMATPLGLRFIAQMGEDVYTDLVTEESGVEKKMGMYIMPYSYLADATKYSDGATGVENKNYQNITTKIDHVFYDSADSSVENKIYEYKEGEYRANGVISNLKLANYDREFVGIAYVAETTSEGTTYTFAEFDAADDVRNSTYVAIEAYEDYTQDRARAVFNEYVLGAHMETKGMTETATGSDENRTVTFTYNGNTYDSATAAATAAGVNLSVSLDKSVAYIKNAGGSTQLTAAIKDGSTPVTFNGAHAVFSSSNEDIITVDKTGKVTAVADSGNAKITASFMGKTATCEVFVSKIDFEDGNKTSYFSGTRVASFSVADVNGNKALQAKSTDDSTSDVGVHIKLDLLKAIFEDPSVQYMAFDLKSGATKTGAKVYYHNDGSSWTQYETGGYDTIPVDAFKSYYFTRTEFNDWVTKNVTNGRFIMVGGGLVCGGESLYLDNFRGVTTEEYNADWYSFEYGGLRTNNGNQPLFYTPSSGSWELGFSNINSATACFTNAIVSDGMRAFQFTKLAGDMKLSFNQNTDTAKELEMRGAGYITFDIYVPEGSDMVTKWGSYNGGTLQTGWNTIYVQIDSSNNELIYLSDTTASTYVIDNIQFITEDEYFEKAYSFENGGVTVRPGDSEVSTFYWYGATDRRKSTYSMAITGSPSNPHLTTENTHGGDYALTFTKAGNINLQFRADSEMYARLRNGFTFWMYSTVGINGTATNNFLNGNGQKFNGGAGINVSKNTWTKITVTKDDIVQGTGEAGCRFMSIVGSTNGTYYIDDIQALPPVRTITLVDGASSTTQAVYKGYEYTLPTPTTYTREFLGWFDGSGNKVENSGVWALDQDVTLTARYSDVKAIDFEDGVVPSYLTKGSQTESLSVVSLNGGKVLKMQGSASGTNHALNVPLAFLAEYFADPNVAFVAFDVKSETTQHTNFRRSTIRTTGSVGSWGQEPYEADVQADNTQVLGYRFDAFKSFFFSRTDYNNWVNNNKTVEMLISAGNFAAGESLYVDNIRPITQTEYDEANYGFEAGGIRPNGGNLLVYYANTGSTWQYAITADSVSGSKPTFSSFGYTNDNVTQGMRALTFTKTAGQTTMRFNSTSVANFIGVANATGYYAFDLFVPEGVDAVLTYPGMTNAAIPGHEPIKGGWMTIYCQNNTNECVKVTDTTGGTYMLDNFRSVTEAEYVAAQYSFEAGTIGLRTNLLNDANTNSGSAYVYNKGADYNSVFASLSIAEGNGSGDVNALSNVRFDTSITHGGEFSLAFDKGNGYVALSRHASSQALQNFAVGFTFWIYSTVEIDGENTSKFYNGVNGKFNQGAGLTIPANTWTQVLVTAEDIGNGRFLILQGSWSATIYLDDFQIVDLEKYTITYDAQGGAMDSSTQTVYYGYAYELMAPTFHREFLGWVDENGDLFPMNGIWEIQGDVTLTATYAEPPEHYYNSESELESEGVVYNLTLNASTYTSSGGAGALPVATASTDSEDMSYYRFGDEYGLDDFLVFDFTGNNMPIMSFFNSDVTNSLYNRAQSADVKGWMVANAMFVNNQLPYGGFAGAHANRLTIIGPYNITYKFDDNGSVALQQTRTSIGSVASPSPVAMSQLNDKDQYRVLVGWVPGSTGEMNLRMIVWNMTMGVEIVNYNQDLNVAKADWEGDIALYGHFARETKLDAVYPIVVDGLDAALEMYTPSMLTYKTTWDGNKATLAASTYSGNVSYPTTADMSYIAFNGSYGLNDYVVFDITGSNMPIVSFFNNTITNTIYNNNGTGSAATVKDASVTGWVWANGLYLADGSAYGGITGAHASRLALIGKQKVIGYDQGTNGFRVNLGSADDVNPLSIRALSEVTDTYRIILGIGKHANASRVYVEMAAINMVTGALVYSKQWEVSTAASEDGSIILYGQHGKTTVLDSVYGIEEDTTLNALISKYAKDVDYNDEEAVTLDRYGYSSISDGQWTLDGNNQVANPTDFRELQSTYDTYAASGLTVLLPQTSFVTDGSANLANTRRYMDMAANAGLKVILTDWHIQIISTPVKVTSNGATNSDSTYKPWVLASDVNSDGTGKTVEVQTYLDALKAYGLTADTTRFKDQNALDAYLMNEISGYKDHPAFMGVMLGDEPSYHNAYCYGLVYRSLKRIMPEIYVQYNLLPMEQSLNTIKYRYPGLKNKSSATNAEIETAYTSYVTSFLDSMGTDYIQYDDYPFKSAVEDYWLWEETVPYVDNTSLRNIQLIAEIAKERNLSVKVVTQACLMKSGGKDGATHIRQVSEDDARWLNNYLMGFGVKQINYFTYWTKASNSSSGEWYEDGYAFVDRNGNPTYLYEIMQTILAENADFAPTISHFDYKDSHIYGSKKSQDNAHITWSGSLTDNNNYSFKWITNVTTNNEYTLVTELFDEERYNYMYMFMNVMDPYYGGKQTVTITLDSSVKQFYVYGQDGERLETVTGNTYTVTLTAGQAIYIMPCAW